MTLTLHDHLLQGKDGRRFGASVRNGRAGDVATNKAARSIEASGPRRAGAKLTKPALTPGAHQTMPRSFAAVATRSMAIM